MLHTGQCMLDTKSSSLVANMTEKNFIQYRRHNLQQAVDTYIAEGLIGIVQADLYTNNLSIFK